MIYHLSTSTEGVKKNTQKFYANPPFVKFSFSVQAYDNRSSLLVEFSVVSLLFNVMSGITLQTDTLWQKKPEDY